MEIMMNKNHTCKLCSRRFSNGRALGGHMRSHVVSAGAAATTASTSSADDDQIPPPVSVSYVLRENPKRSVKLSDPQYLSSSAAAAYLVHPVVDHGDSLIVQDQESDVESSPRAAARRRRQRSKRRKRASPPPPPPLDIEQPASSVSDATTEEDVAMSLIMLSRDTWINPVVPDPDEPVSDAEPDKGSNKARTRFECNTCKKVFGSFQALGGHRAGFKNGKARCAGSSSSDEKPGTVPIHGFVSDSATNDNVDGSSCKPGGTHPCPFCLKVFNSGQALGGHKKSHQKISFTESIGTGNSNGGTTSVPASSSSSPVGFIDLNLPAPVEDEFEMSAVYDGEFDQIKMACN